MCGIAALIAPAGQSVDRDVLERMIRALGHRGPDGFRLEVSGRIGLAHARLSIIDLEGGWQPLNGPQGTQIVGNGEVYNYLELAAENGLEGQLQTGSDFEPFLHLLAREGPQAHTRLRGMYGLVVRQGDKALVVRDPFGIKPLYVCEGPWGRAYASEPRAFFAAGLIGAVVDPARLLESLDLHYTNGRQTIWRGIARVMPGEAIEDLPDAPQVRTRREVFTPRPQPAHDLWQGNQAQAIEALDRVLEDSVRVHLRADVPFGLFLSGGIDSASVATLMARFGTQGVAAFTCGFDVPGAADERAQAQRVADHFGFDFHAVDFTSADFWCRLPALAWAFDEPCADYAALPVHKLAQAAREQLRVVLTGEGGDELFGGYGRYRKAMRPWPFGGVGTPASRLARAGLLRPGITPLWRKDWAAHAGLAPDPRAPQNRAQAATQLGKAQRVDVETWLHADLLLKLDRCLMAYGLEGRTPFLDPQVAAFAAGLPDGWKVKGRFGKMILRQWLAQHCPPAQPFARKQGFTVPVGAWIGQHAGALGPLIARSQVLAPIIVPAQIEALFAAYDARLHGPLAWTLLFHAVWGAVHLEGADASGSVWDVLGA